MRPIERVFKGTFTMCRCRHLTIWKEGEGGCAECLIEERGGEVVPPGVEGIKSVRPEVRVTKNGKYYIPGKGFIKKEEAFI